MLELGIVYLEGFRFRVFLGVSVWLKSRKNFVFSWKFFSVSVWCFYYFRFIIGCLSCMGKIDFFRYNINFLV